MSKLTFELWLYKTDRKPSTIEKHVLRLSVLQREVKVFTDEDITSFLLEKKKQGISNKTLNAYVDTLRVYAQYADIPHLRNIPYFKKIQTIKATMSIEEIERFLSLHPPPGCNRQVFERWGLFWKICIFTGMRMGEVGNLIIQDFDFGRGVLIVRESKTGRPRHVPIPNNIHDDLVEACRVSGGNNNSGDECPIFTTSRGEKFSDHSWGHDFSRRIKLLGISRKGLTPYSLRHSFATELYRKKIPAQILARMLGNSVDMIENTYAHMVFDDLVEAQKEHPLVAKTVSPHEKLELIKKYILECVDERFKSSISHDGNLLRVEVEIKV